MGRGAFAKARTENKPIFLSVGYSTCHWCHVMERESFDDAKIATYMNHHFVNIKVDREERPDVDNVYMTFVQATTGGGGWPMSVWLTPDLRPFLGGTYFPPEDAYGRPGFLSVLKQIAEAWEKDEKQIRNQADQITGQLQNLVNARGTSSTTLNASMLSRGFKEMEERFDAREGGFGPAPKFPRPSELLFLFSEAYRVGPDSKEGKRAIEMATFTLEKMAAGGIYDHLGGGFHRYSVDGQWHVPHFEKMLYDQAQLAEANLIAFQITGGRHSRIRRAASSIIRPQYDLAQRWILFRRGRRRFIRCRHPNEKAEGAFYVWTVKEIEEALGEERAAEFDISMASSPRAIRPWRATPRGEFSGKEHPHPAAYRRGGGQNVRGGQRRK